MALCLQSSDGFLKNKYNYKHNNILLSKKLGSVLAIRSVLQILKSHFQDPQTYFCDFIAMFQLVKYLSFNSHTYLDNSVFFSQDLFLKEYLWFL